MGSTTSNGVFNENKNKKMTKEPKIPHKLKWGNRTSAKVDEVDYLIGVGAWHMPENLMSVGGYVFMKKLRAGGHVTSI
jgi:hypothetical protein|nr:MAG TPA: hypothetical protein [Caudoviricetes sp.]